MLNETILLQDTLAGIIDSAMDAIITIDSAQRITLFNAAAERMFRYLAVDAIGQSIDRFIPARYCEGHRRHIEQFGISGVTKRSMGSLDAVFGLRADGEEFPVEASISQLECEGQKFYTVILRDITARKQAEEKLREQAALLDQAQEAILVHDWNHRITFWNKGAERVYGWTAEEAVNHDVRLLIYQADTSAFDQAIAVVLESGQWNGEIRQVTKEGREIIVDCHWSLVRNAAGTPNSLLSINTNVTEQKKLEAQFLRAQRLESIGTVAGGIAHDLNNVLAPILMAVHLLRQKVSDDSSRRLLEVLRSNVERGSDLIKQILLFARGIDGERVPIQLRPLIEDVVKLLRPTFSKSISLECKLSDDLWIVNGDATQLHQVLMNLCVNARDAMPIGGTLILAADNQMIDQNYAEMMLDARPGKHVRISVSDTGSGIAPEHVRQIFDPFFTTKAVGHGTGLGLSTVLGILKSHSGFVNVYSELGKGTQFTIYLPAADTQAFLHAQPQVLEPCVGRGQLILVVDDELAIREITKSTLESFNYRVVVAENGAQALACIARHLGEIQCVVTDMMMPVMDGMALMLALREIDPHLKVIATSGHFNDAKFAEVARAGVHVFLPKPYTADQLLGKLNELLTDDRRGPIDLN